MICASDYVSLWLQALGIALRLTFDGNNQLLQLETAYCIVVRHWPSLMACVIQTQCCCMCDVPSANASLTTAACACRS